MISLTSTFFVEFSHYNKCWGGRKKDSISNVGRILNKSEDTNKIKGNTWDFCVEKG